MPRPAGTGSSRILVVDDELHGRELCMEFLSLDGYETASASDGEAALEMLGGKTFDILLTDIQMPGMDGVTLLKEAKKRYPELEIILMTAYGGLPTAIEAIRSGAYDYLVKPFSREFLLNSVRRCAEKINLQQMLHESQSRLVEKEKLAALGAVAGWMSHRMRNSLSVILMCAHYLSGKQPDPQSDDFKQVVTAVIEKTKGLERMTSDFISYSKPYDLQMVSGDISALLEQVVESLMVQIQIQKVFLDERLASDLPPVACDPHTLHEVFENIVVNALQAIGTKEGETLKVLSENAVDGQGLPVVRVSIANTGSAIPREHLDKIFEPFFTTKENGSGLGLAIVRKVVEHHGGKVRAESGEKNGAKYTAIDMEFPCMGRRT